MGLKALKPVSSPGPKGRHCPKHGMTNKKYAEDHGITVRAASRARRGESWT